MKRVIVLTLAVVFIMSMFVFGIGCKKVAKEVTGEAAEEVIEEVAEETQKELVFGYIMPG